MTQRTQSIVTWTSVAVMLGSVMWAMRTLPTKDLTESLQAWIETLGIWGPVVFGAIVWLDAGKFLAVRVGQLDRNGPRHVAVRLSGTRRRVGS